MVFANNLEKMAWFHKYDQMYKNAPKITIIKPKTTKFNDSYLLNRESDQNIIL